MLYLDTSTNTILVAKHTSATATSIVFASSVTSRKTTLTPEDYILTVSEYFYTFKLLDTLDMEPGSYVYSIMNGTNVIETGVAMYTSSTSSNEVSYETETEITQYIPE